MSTRVKFWSKERLALKEKIEQERLEELKKLKVIKKFVNQHGYSDVEPYEVVGRISDITVEIRKMDTKQIKFPQDVHVGGFSAHTVDNIDGQDYEYTSNEEYPIMRIRWSKSNGRWQMGACRFLMSDKPYKFYDYNF